MIVWLFVMSLLLLLIFIYKSIHFIEKILSNFLVNIIFDLSITRFAFVIQEIF